MSLRRLKKGVNDMERKGWGVERVKENMAKRSMDDRERFYQEVNEIKKKWVSGRKEREIEE